MPTILGPLTPITLIVACAAITAGATVQGSVGFGIGLVSAPILALIDPVLVPGPVLFCGVVLMVLVTFRERREMDVSGVTWGIVGRVFGTIGAAVLLSSVPKQELTVLLGGLILLAVALSVSGLHLQPTLWALIGAGTLSGFMSTIASAGGPPMALLYQKATGARLRSTMGGFLLLGSILSIVALVAVGQFGRTEFLASLALLPGTLIGFALSTRLRATLDRGYTRTAVLVVATASATAAILRQVL